MIQNPSESLVKRRNITDLLIKNILVFCAYLLTAWLGLSVPFAGDKVTLFWLPSGIAVAAVYRWGWKLLPSVFLAALTINLLTGGEFATNLILPLVIAWDLWSLLCYLKNGNVIFNNCTNTPPSKQF